MKDNRLKQQSEKYLLTLLVLFLVCVYGHITHAQDVPQLAEKALASTVYLEMMDTNGKPISYGSGFFVSPTLIVTNFHVVAGTAKGTAKLVDKPKTYRIQGVTATDTKNDLTLLKVTVPGIKPLQLGDSNNMRIGEKVYVAGNPKGLEGTFSDGIISRISTQGNRKRLQMTAPISPGSSGGPVLNGKGEVIGVAFMTLIGGQNLNFAIPSEYVKALLDTNATATPLSQVEDIIDANAHFIRGKAKFRSGLYKLAVLDFDAAIRLDLDEPRYYVYRGMAQGELGHHFAAMGDYDTAIRLKPDYAWVYNNRGWLKYKIGLHQLALMDFDTALRLEPNNATTYRVRGLVKAKLGLYDAAIVDCDTALRLEPNNAIVYVSRGIVKYEQGLKKTQRNLLFAAVADFYTAIHLNPDNVDAYIYRGNIRTELNLYYVAVDDYDAAIRLDPDNTIAYYNRGNVKKKLGQTWEAKRDLRTALKLATQAGDVELKTDIEKDLRQLK